MNKKVLVLGGSPKGSVSVTMEYVKYMDSVLEDTDFIYAYPGKDWGKLERDETFFHEMMEQIGHADGILFAAPVYYTLIASGFKRFIELINERGKSGPFRGKPAAVLLTSIHYHDQTALNYMHGLCDDWEMLWSGEHSPAMRDLLTREGKESMEKFALSFHRDLLSPPLYMPSFAPLPSRSDWIFKNEPPKDIIDLEGRKAVIICDDRGADETRGFIENIEACVSSPVPVYNLKDLIKGPCLGCLKCGPGNHCVYEGKDGYIEAFKEWMEADILIMAGTMKDRYLSSLWKSFFDRSFWRTHQPSLAGKQIIWCISGPLSHEQNLQEILRNYSEFHEINLAGFVTDECRDNSLIGSMIGQTLSRAVYNSVNSIQSTPTFRRIGGFKVFRDEIAGGLKMIFRQDHRAYRKSRIYDFPLANPFKRLGLAGAYLITALPFIQKEMFKDMPHRMVSSFQKTNKK